MFKIFLKKFWPVFLIILFSGILLTENLNKPFIGYHDWNSVVYARSAKTLIGKSALPGIYLQSHYPLLLPLFLSGSFLFFGIHDWAARIVPITAITATAIMIYLLGKQLWSQKEGWLAALFFLFTPLIRYFAKIPVHETIMPFFSTLVFYNYWLWYKNSSFRKYLILLICIFLAMQVGWPAYFIVPLITFHYLLFYKKRKKILIILNFYFISLFSFSITLFINQLLIGETMIKELWSIFLVRTALNPDNNYPFMPEQLFNREFLWIRVYLTRILSILVIIGLIKLLISLIKNSDKAKNGFLLILGTFGLMYLIIFSQASWLHDYVIIYLFPFFVIISAQTLKFFSERKTIYYGLILVICSLMIFESKDFISALEKTHDFYPAHLLGEKIKKISEPHEQFFIGSEEGGKMYGVYLDYYADRIHDLGEPSYDEFLINENQYKTSFRYFIVDELHNYLSPDLVKYLLYKYSWQQTGQFKIFDLKK